MLILVSAANSDAASLGEVKKGTLVEALEKKGGQAQRMVSSSPVAGTAAWIH